MKNIVLIFAAALILSACRATPKECTRKDIVPPKELRRPSVQYPPASQNDGDEGTVTLLLAVQTDGSISDIRIARSSGYQRLDAAAVRSLRQAKFQPATCHGKPIAVRIHQSFIFKID
ncbi:TonB family C-terminal domain [Kingella denitrificans]|uniref:TonB-dependent receptor n=1 Tax=Kingella denitrificans ATCC 33394 TaxID=888741 RepID=F0EYW8_9NEIS|nr:energy transducer TonB [Kingella denitrificans]EGC17726.1 TonB-dependent receptor [Kingella denitrificans ATCC 33394]QQB41684.1 energy transducer TonB [Kingella denitrificans]STR12458.1 TonB family C-terminal domain [Kingella denitrificans]